MKRPTPATHWPDSWRSSFGYDLQEVYGEPEHFGYAYAYRTRREATLGLIEEVLPRGSRILDVAAAQGNFSLTLAEAGYDVTWNDLRAELADYVRMKHDRGTVRYAPGNAFELSCDSGFDAVLITEVIEHVAHPDQFLEKTAALVRPGGYVVMTTPNGAYCRNTLPRFSDCPDPSVYEAVQFKPNADGHIFLLHPDEVRDLAGRAGLEVDALRLLTNPLTAGHMKTERLLTVLPDAVVSLLERASRYLPAALQERGLVQIAARFRKPHA